MIVIDRMKDILYKYNGLHYLALPRHHPLHEAYFCFAMPNYKLVIPQVFVPVVDKLATDSCVSRGVSLAKAKAQIAAELLVNSYIAKDADKAGVELSLQWYLTQQPPLPFDPETYVAGKTAAEHFHNNAKTAKAIQDYCSQ